ncbi:MAG: rod shape-determining protein [Treponema sp.]|jgi:rod shape-determining protein MreB|nr:rod shape-determining protein [Treponema sp.]
MLGRSSAIGIDLGTCNTLIYVAGKGILINEPSVVAVEKGTNKVMAVGTDAKKMLFKTPGSIHAIRPMRGGVIADLESTEKMIRYFISKALPRYRFIKPRMVFGIPSSITEVERRAVEECAYKAGAREVVVIPESLAAAIGADIPINEPAGHMICDIGGGTTEISVISLGDMVVTNAIRTAGDDFDEAIIKYTRSELNLIIGGGAAERLKIELGNAFPEKESEKVEIKGTDAGSGLPKRLEISSGQIRDALKIPVYKILDEIKSLLGKTPPELAADIVERGIIMSGGGSLLKGLPKLISRETGVSVILAQNPLDCVALGAGKYFEKPRGFENIRSVYDNLN